MINTGKRILLKIARPVMAISRTAGRIAEDRMYKRTNNDDQEDEISQPCHSCNLMMTRLEIVFNELKQKERESRESELKYQTLLNNLPQRIFLKDINSVYISCNELYAKDMKISSHEIKGKTDCDFYPVELAEKYRMADKNIIRSGKQEMSEERYCTDGREIIVRTIRTPVRDENGNMEGILSILEDISDEKQKERQKVELENQLRQLQKMEAITQLTSGIAHDFNNILTAISGNAFILQRKLRSEPELMQFVEDIIYTSETAAHLTRRLLTFSRRQIIDVRPISLNQIVSNINNLLRRIIGEDITLDVQLTEREISILADKGQMEQILVNLAANARDAMPKGGTLSIRTEIVNLDGKFSEIHSYGNPGKYALLTVTDSGTGMDDYTKKRIFEPFFTTKEIGKGTGLGLSIVYGIVKQHNGYINVYSEQGIGTSFKLYFPFLASSVSGNFEFGKYMIHMRGTETILITEDDERVRFLTKKILEEFGYTVIDTADGEEAISMYALNKDRIKLVILDVIMPKKNGKQVYNEIALICPGIKAIFMSGYNEDIFHKNGILDEGSNFISKPFVPSELLKKIREVLDNPVRDFHQTHV